MKRRLRRFYLPVWLTPRALWLAAGVAFLLALGGVNAILLPLAVAAGVALIAALAADAVTMPPRASLAVERQSADRFALRKHAQISYAVENRSAHPARVTIVETPAALLSFDPEDLTLDVPPRSRAAGVRGVTPLARGTGTFGALYLEVRGRAGLWMRRERISAEAPLRVFPDLSAVERYGTLHARNRTVESGLRRMRERGAGSEFESLREWSSGDPFRSIDWKATARRGRVMVTHYEVERSQNVMLVLDAGRLMTPWLGDQRKFDYALTAALSTGVIAGLASDKVGVVAFAKQIIAASAPRPSGASLSQLVALVHGVQPRMEESDYSGAFEYLRAHVRKRSLIVFFTDMFDPVAQTTLLAEIATLARRHLVVCVFMNDAAIEGALRETPADVVGAYRAGVALELERERRSARAVLERLGVQTIDVPAQQLTTALIDEYLRIKQRSLI